MRDGRVGAVALPWVERSAARQLGALTAVLPGGSSVWAAACTAALLLGAVSAVLLWAVVRRLGCGGVPTALAVAVAGVTPPALALHSSPSTAVVGLPWLLLAALLAWRGRALGVVAGVAAVVAALTAPLLGAVLLALAASVVLDRTRSGVPARSRGVPPAAVLGVAAVATAVAAAGSGPLAGRAAPVVGTGAAVTGAVCGLVLVAVAARRAGWTRPLLVPTVVVLAVLLVPGPGRAAAALTALVLLAVVVAAVADDVASRVPAPARAGVGVAALAAAAVAALMAAPLRPPAPARADPGPLLAWAGVQRGALHADPLDRADLLLAGFPAERLRDRGAPVADDDVVLLAERPGAPATHCAAGTLLATLPRPGGAPAEVCAAHAPVTDPDPAGRAGRARIGTALAGNPSLTLEPGAAELLRAGDVDPRLVIVLAALSGAHTLAVADFPAAPLEPGAAVRRQVLVTAVDGAPAGGDAPSALRDWLRGQHPPYVPAVVRGDAAGLLVGYGDTAPPGLVPS